MKSKKKLALASAIVAVAVFAAGATLAWLTDTTQTVVNTFTVGNVDIDLTETWNTDSNDDGENDCWTAKMIPGTTVTKDPVVTVEGGSEACWLFVKVKKDGGVVTVGEKQMSFDNFMSYAIITGEDGWRLLESTDDGDVYYREVAASNGEQNFHVLVDDEVSINTTVTKAMLDALTESLKISDDNQPTLSFTAYAVQMSGFEDNAAGAWNEVK